MLANRDNRNHRRNNHHNNRDNSSSQNNRSYRRETTAEADAKRAKRTLAQLQLKERVKNTMKVINDSFNTNFHGYPSHTTEQTNQQISSQAINFVVQMLMWFVIFVKPHLDVFSEEMAIEKLITHLKNEAKSQFQIHNVAHIEKCYLKLVC